MKPTLQEFTKRNQLTPLCELTDNDRKLLFGQSNIFTVEPRTLITNEASVIVYLLEGDVNLLSSGFISENFTHTHSRALAPLFNDALEEDSVLFTSHGVLLEVDRELFDGLYLQSQAKSIEQSETELNLAEEELFKSLFEAFQNNKLDLPVLPEAALKIRKAVHSGDVGSQEIINFVQTDAVLSARLLKVANSPLYGTWRQIKTVKDAVRRLGIEVTRDLSFSLSVHQLYHAKTSMIKGEMKALYNLTRRISSLAFTLCKEFAGDLDPEQAVLSSLLQGIGALPILQYIDSHPYLAQTQKQLKCSIEKLNVPISILLFNEWHFDNEYIEYIEHAEDWSRDHQGAIDYCDVLIAARLLCYYESKNLTDDFPAFESLPVLNKLGIFDNYKSLNAYLKHTAEEVSSMDGLLS